MRRLSPRQRVGLVLFLVTALCAAGCVFVLWRTHQAEAALADLQQQVQTQPAPAPEEDAEDPETETEETPLVFPAALQAQNGDLAAWLRVSGTGIDLPVMLTPDDPEHYLRRGFAGKYSLSGTPFFDARCTAPAAADCLIIYGHNMQNGTMFSDLKAYESAAFARANPTLTLALPEETRTYQVFAALHLDTDVPEDLALYDSAGTLNETQFASLIHRIQSRALYTTGIQPRSGQKLLLLSTCSRHTSEHTKNGRMVVVGVQQ